MQISVKSNVKEVLKDYKRIEKGIKKKALTRALNTTGKKAHTQIRKRIVKESKLKSQYVNRKMEDTKANYTTLTYSLTATTRQATNLIEWVSTSQQKKFLNRRTSKGKLKKGISAGVVANAWGTRRAYKGAFVIKGKYSGKPVVVSQRPGVTGRGWSKTIYGPIVWREFSRYAEEETRTAVRRYFNKEFARQINLLDSRSRK